uniref:RNA-directed DNA polymerase n=1 Tax=Strongyloides venezuelensis TaxID=75913 RepID=A0A0K0FSE5_STRVS
MIPLVLFNAERSSVQLYKDTHIGMIHTIQELNDDTLLVNSEKVIPDDADWEETLSPYPARKIPLDKFSFIELIILTNTLLTEEGKSKLFDIFWEYKLAFHEYDGQPGLYSGNQRLNNKHKTDEVPRRIKPSRMSIEKEREISKQIADNIRTEMIEPIIDKPTPRTYKEVKSFLGAASYFRRHIRNFSAIAEPLYKLDKSFLWKNIHGDAFKKLKDALINATTLSPPDNTKNYTILTDASFQGLDAALVQQDKPIAFVSKSLKPAEKNYPIIELEALDATTISDGNMEYDLTIQYIKGDTNNVADYLSRDSFLAIDVKEKILEEVFPSDGHPSYNIDKFIQFYSEKKNEIIPNTGKIRTPSSKRIYVLHQLREKLLETFHKHPLLGGHLSFDKINGRFKSILYRPKMDLQMLTSWRTC